MNDQSVSSYGVEDVRIRGFVFALFLLDLITQ
jgi:hypothetical protein